MNSSIEPHLQRELFRRRRFDSLNDMAVTTTSAPSTNPPAFSSSSRRQSYIIPECDAITPSPDSSRPRLRCVCGPSNEIFLDFDSLMALLIYISQLQLFSLCSVLSASFWVPFGLSAYERAYPSPRFAGVAVVCGGVDGFPLSAGGAYASRWTCPTTCAS